jgi:hypothetical protein
MKKVEEYLEHAVQCRELAARGDKSTRQQLESMAQTWEQLAEDRRKQLERQKRIGNLEASKR